MTVTTDAGAVSDGELFAMPSAWTDMDAWHARVAEIREATPVLAVDLPGFERYWVVTRHKEVFAVSRDSDLWNNTVRSQLMPDEEWQKLVASGMPLPRTLVHLDGEEHRTHRQVTAPLFKPTAVAQRQPRLDELADMFVQRMRDMDGECDFALDIAQAFTMRVIMEIYGVPEADEPLMLELTQGLFGAADPEYLGDVADPHERLMASVMRLIGYFEDITTDRRRSPRDDLASVIANGKPGGCPMGDAERLWYFIIVATAGHDTTSFALAGGMEAMLRDPEQLRALHDDPTLVVNAADECIRWTSPVRHFLRYATEDTEIAGVAIPKDGRVLLSYPSANRDAAVFADPMRFDVRRPDANRLVSFGVGEHFCLGSQFARRELRTLLGKLAAELAYIEPAGPAEWSASNFVSGVKHLPVRYGWR